MYLCPYQYVDSISNGANDGIKCTNPLFLKNILNMPFLQQEGIIGNKILAIHWVIWRGKGQVSVNELNKMPDFSSLRSVSAKLFKLISKRLNVDTAYVTKRGENEMTVLSSYNKNREIIPVGYSVEYADTYCRLIIQNSGRFMHTVNLGKDAITKELEVTDQLKVKGFLGVTLSDTKGNVFGTLCVMDEEERTFSEEEVDYLKSMADVLSHIIEFDQAKYNLGILSVPIIPIVEGMSILSLQGVIDEERAEQIMTDVLQDAAKNDMDYFIIDLSKLLLQEHSFPNFLGRMITALQLMGVETIVTGITPVFAQEQIKNSHLNKLKTTFVQDIQSALRYGGYELLKK